MLQDVRKIINANIERATKGSGKYTILECLNSLNVQRIRELSAVYSIDGRAKMNKSELISKLIDKIIDKNHIKIVLDHCRKKFLNLLEDLISNEYLDISTMPIVEYRGFLQLGLIYTFTDKKSVIAIMPKEIKEKIKDLNLEQIARKEKRYELVEEYIDAFAHVYGMYEPDLLVSTFNYNEDEKLSIEEFENIFKRHINLRRYLKKYNGMIVHEIILMEEIYDSLLKERTEKDYYLLSKYDVNIYSKNNYINMTSSHKKLKDYIKNICKDRKLTDIVLLELCSPLARTNLDIAKALGSFDARKIQVKNVRQLDEFTRLLVKVDNSTRKWGNKGYTNRELKRLKEKNQGNNIGRNKLCSCGSGKKYKYCCEKNS